MFKVMSTNIRFDNPADGEFAWPWRKKLLANKIKELEVDIFGTQEGREPQLRELESLVDQDIIDSHRDWIAERMYPSLYMKNFTSNASGDIWLSETPDVAGSKSFDSMFPRLATWSCNNDFFICNVHLDHDKESTRFEQARVLVSQIQKHHRDLPIILMGDFNTAPQSEVYDYITSHLNLIDPWVTNNKKEETSFHMFKGVNPDGYRIDWILVSEEFKVNQIELIKDEYDGIFLSDHFPVFCELELK